MLDARKLARIVANRARMRQGRTRTVTLVYARPEGTAYVGADVVWRPQMYSEPASWDAPESAATVHAEFPLELDPRQVSLVADTATPTAEAVAAAPSYEVRAYRAAGLSTNRWSVELRRLR